MKANGSHGFQVLAVCVAVILVADSGVRADFTFGQPVNLGPNINSSSIDAGTSISADGCALYFSSTRPGGRGGWDLWVATRLTTDADWGPPENLGPTVNTPSDDGPGSISADGLSLYFASNRAGGFGSYDTWVTTRATKGGVWGIPVNLGLTVNSATGDDHPSISADGLSLYFVSNRAGGSGSGDLWVTTRATLSDLWGPPVNLGPTVNSSDFEEWPGISADGLLLFFFSNRAGNGIWVTRRATVSDPWGSPVNLGPPVNTSVNDFGPNVSADGRTFYFSSDRPGGYGNIDIWQTPIIPIVDFNGDENVDINDLVIHIEHWGTSDTVCDVGPMPWGDGKVDEKDLEVLMSYWQQEILDPALAVYWKLDETSGMMAADCIGASNGTLVGNPIWQPAGGKLGGALQLDGIDGYVRTPFVVDPAKGPFSVFAWVKGGEPGQVILSQAGGANWLTAGDPGGVLATDLKESGRKGKPLVSAAVITDGAWHRVGFVWDGSKRTLYVDGAEVAKDTQSSLSASSGGLYIGAGANLTPGTFWSGLIDDVRVYDRVVKP
ncbi:MAG: LamG domain-containing protein [Phycisphaerae bacterium]|nr:LamG domain-containing protein [Phycisphaerae bacterium]